MSVHCPTCGEGYPPGRAEAHQITRLLLAAKRFKLVAYKDGRHYTLHFCDLQPPALQPYHVFAEGMAVEGQWEHLQLALQAMGIEVEVRLGAPLPDGADLRTLYGSQEAADIAIIEGRVP